MKRNEQARGVYVKRQTATSPPRAGEPTGTDDGWTNVFLHPPSPDLASTHWGITDAEIKVLL